jgi:glucose-6-phosphate isomerase
MPKRENLKLDYALMLRGGCGPYGKPEGDMPAMLQDLSAVKTSLRSQWKSGRVPFFSVLDRQEDIAAARALATDVRRRFKTLVVVGIGGSDLGTRAILKALPPAKGGMTVNFLGANTDPEEVAAVLKEVDWRRTALNVVSKSGNTVEPLATFLVLRDRLIRAVGRKAHASHVICTTGESGALREIARREGYRTLPVPEDVGGRFSVLTPVGLFPIACAGLDAKGLLAGAAAVRDEFSSAPVGRNAPLIWAGLQHDAFFRGERITVLMPYAESLREFAFWFRQLWAESLGKSHDRDGRIVHAGFTPVAALGATDQHSQIQLYAEGPADKTVTFIEVEKMRADFTVPKPYSDLEGAAYLGGHRMSAILKAERLATARALAVAGHPNCTLTLPGVTPASIGGLLMFFMVATAAAAELFEVNAYDQPGVEAGKQIIYSLLGRRSSSKR